MDVNKILNSKPEIKKKAIAALLKKGGMHSLEAMVLLSLDSNAGVRYAARKGLSRLRQDFNSFGKNIDHNIREIFIEKNLEILKAASGPDQLKAAERLGRSDAGSYARELVNTLKKSRDSKLIATLLKTIANSCGSRSLPLLKKYLKSEDNRIRANAVEAISLLEISERYDLILPYLTDNDRRVTCNAAVTLWSFSKEKVYSRLKSMLDSGNTDKIKSVIWCLRTIGTLETRGLLSNIPEDNESHGIARDAIRKLDKALALSLGDKSNTLNQNIEKVVPVSGMALSAKKASLIEKLHSNQNLERLEAAKELSKFRDTSLLPELTTCLEAEDDPYVIATLVKLVGLTGGNKSSKSIIPFLKNSDPRVRANTVEGLATISDEGVIKTLKPLLLDNEPRVKANAALVIHRRFPEQIIKILKDMLLSGDTWKSLSAAFALGNLNEPECEEVLRDNLYDLPEGVRPKIEEIISQIENRKFHESKVIAEELSTVQNLAYTTIEDAFSALDNDVAATRIKALRCLSILGDEAVGIKIEKMIKIEDSFIVKSEMIKTLADLRKENCIHVLKKALKEKSRPVRKAAAYSLASINTPSSLHCLQDLIESSDTSLAAIGISTLLRSQNIEFKSAARKKIENFIASESSLDRNQAIQCLSEMQDSWSIEMLGKLTRDFDINVAKNAKEVLNQFESDTVEKVREIAAKAHYRLQELDDEFINENKNFLIDIQIDLLEASDPDLKKQALLNLNALIEADTLGYFKKVLMTQQNKFLRATVIKVVGKHKSHKTIDVLEQFLKDYDPRVRANCVEALTGFRDPIIYDLVSPLLYDNDERVKTNAYRLLSDLFPFKTKSRLMDMLKESKSYSRSLRKRFYESAKFIIESEKDQVCSELCEWFSGKRQEDKAALEKAKELEEERIKNHSNEKVSKSFIPLLDTESDQTVEVLKFFGKIAIFFLISIGAMLYYHDETRIDKSKKSAYTLDTSSASYDATNILNTMEFDKSDIKPGVKVKGRRIRTGQRFIRNAISVISSRKREKSSYAFQKKLIQMNTEAAFDSAGIEDVGFRKMIINATSGNENVFKAEQLINNQKLSQAYDLLQETLIEYQDDNPALKMRIYFLLTRCCKGLRKADKFAEYSEQLDIVKTKVNSMAVKAGIYGDKEIDVDKINEDIKNVKALKNTFVNMTQDQQQNFITMLKKNLSDSGYKGKELEFEYEVLKARFGIN